MIRRILSQALVVLLIAALNAPPAVALATSHSNSVVPLLPSAFESQALSSLSRQFQTPSNRKPTVQQIALLMGMPRAREYPAEAAAFNFRFSPEGRLVSDGSPAALALRDELKAALSAIPWPPGEEGDAEMFLRRRLAQQGIAAFSIVFEPGRIAETTLIRNGATRITIDPRLSGPLRTLAILKAMTNLVYPERRDLYDRELRTDFDKVLKALSDEQRTMVPFVQAAIAHIGLAAIAEALEDAAMTFGAGVEPLLELFLRLHQAQLMDELADEAFLARASTVSLILDAVDDFLLSETVHRMLGENEGILLPFEITPPISVSIHPDLQGNRYGLDGNLIVAPLLLKPEESDRLSAALGSHLTQGRYFLFMSPTQPLFLARRGYYANLKEGELKTAVQSEIGLYPAEENFIEYVSMTPFYPDSTLQGFMAVFATQTGVNHKLRVEPLHIAPDAFSLRFDVVDRATKHLKMNISIPAELRETPRRDSARNLHSGSAA